MTLLGLFHFILNLVGLMFWLRWREEMMHSRRGGTGGTLLGTLRRAARTPVYRWSWLGLLACLIVVRAMGYWHMGSAIGWTPAVDLGAVVISFRSDMFSRMLLFSGASLVVFVAEFYFWLLLVSAVNWKVSDADLFQNRVRAHLGWVERWPGFLKLLLPFVVAGSMWVCLEPTMSKLGFTLPTRTMSHTIQQALVIGVASFMVWKYLIAGLLLLHMVTSYVYLGNSPFWNFINLTGQNLLRPISWIPLRLGRVDLGPILGAAVVLFLGELGDRELPALYQTLPRW